MSTRLDADTRIHLETDHARFESRVRDLLLNPGPQANWTREVDALATDIAHHLDEEASGVIARLEHEGDSGKRAARVLRTNAERIRSDLDGLRGRDAADAATLLLLSYDLTTHGTRAEAVLDDWEAKSSLPDRHTVASETLCVGAGMVVGATVGAVAGPLGLVGGALAGGVAAGVAMLATHNANEDRRERDAQLDRDIGVFGGHIGEASPNAPRAIIGAFSAAASGAGGGGWDQTEDAAGPMPAPVSAR